MPTSMTPAHNRRVARALQTRAVDACRDAHAAVAAVRGRRARHAGREPFMAVPAMGSLRRTADRVVAASESRRTEGQPSSAARRWARAVVVAERTVMDAGRHPWTVRELDTRDAPGAAAPRCLVFENSEVVRRLWRYPADWLALPDGDLLAIVQAS